MEERGVEDAVSLWEGWQGKGSVSQDGEEPRVGRVRQGREGVQGKRCRNKFILCTEQSSVRGAPLPQSLPVGLTDTFVELAEKPKRLLCPYPYHVASGITSKDPTSC